MTAYEHPTASDIDISVVIPAYNSEAFLAKTIDSALSQDIDALEVIVFDDGSTDRTLEVAGAIGDPRLRVFGPNPNGGVARARNGGYRCSRGRCVMFLDSDDVLRPGALRRLLGTLEAHPHACAAYGTSRLIDEQDEAIGRESDARSYFVKRASGDILPQVLATNFIINGGVILARRASVERTFLYDEELPWSEDWHFTCQLAAAGDFVFVGDEPVLDYRERRGSYSSSSKVNETNYRIALDAVFGHPLVTARITGTRLSGLRRRRWSDVMRRLGTIQLKRRRWLPASGYFFRAVLTQPSNLRAHILLLFSLVRWIPGPIRRRTGI